MTSAEVAAILATATAAQTAEAKVRRDVLVCGAYDDGERTYAVSPRRFASVGAAMARASELYADHGGTIEVSPARGPIARLTIGSRLTEIVWR
jgi:hypothetical protein